VAEEIRKIGRCCVAVQADVTRKSEVDSLAKRITAEFSTIDIRVNNVGVGSNPLMLETSEEERQRIIDINPKSVDLCCQAVAKGMIERKRGSILFLASIIRWTL
jgi:3-oxoacyl-[acyl-carrier protein] reductase